MKAITIIALLALLAVSSQAALVADANDTIDVVTTKYYFSILRGGITGYEKGMYKKTNYAVQSNCLSTTMVNSMHSLYSQYAEGSFDIMSDYTEVMTLLNYLTKYCEFDEALYDLTKWCVDKDCSFSYMGQSLLKKVF